MTSEVLFVQIALGAPSGGGLQPFAAPPGDSFFYAASRCGRQALLLQMTLWNPTNNAIDAMPLLGFGSGGPGRPAGVFQSGPKTTVAPFSNGSLPLGWGLLDRGVQAGIRTSATGLVCCPDLMEFDRHRFLRQPVLTSFALGPNVLYSVPSNRSALLAFPVDVEGNSRIFYFNGSDAPCHAQPFLNGVSCGTQRTVAAGAVGLLHVPPCLGGGDRLQIDTDSDGAGQFAWILGIEAQA